MSDGAGLIYSLLETPPGDLGVAWSEVGLRYLWFAEGDGATAPADDWSPAKEPAFGLREQLETYFSGEPIDFDLPLDAHGTDFQLRVWETLRTIPYGTTCSYGRLAELVGQPGASRAVGGANNKNPLAVVVPCHRVIGADGSLTGYAGGVRIKRFLLDLEAGVGSLLAA